MGAAPREWLTPDLCDAHPEVSVCAPIFRAFGGVPQFSGPIRTVRVFEDNVLVKQALSEPGDGAVLVVDGGGSLRCALVGDLLAKMAIDNGWAGIIVHGAIRDSLEIGGMRLGIRALATHPRKSVKRGEGERDTIVSFGGVMFRPGWHVYADEDGVLVSETELTG